MTSLTPDEATQYWQQLHEAVPVDRTTDVDALGRVCHPHVPDWLNRYYATFQHRVFDDLLDHLPPPRRGARALDVGCGGGRWSRKLAQRGYATVGIDLQDDLVEQNRRLIPEVRFECASILTFEDTPFDAIVTVTVLQHLASGDQTAALQRIAQLLVPGGHALLLENVSHVGGHMFARSVDGWERAGADAGLSLKAVRRYDYSPNLRIHNWLANRLAGRARDASDAPAVPGPPTPRRNLAQRASRASQRAATMLDWGLERVLVRMQPHVSSVHAGFLFRRD